MREGPSRSAIGAERLEAVFRDAQHDREDFDTIGGLIEEVRLVPAGALLSIELRGELAGILMLAQGAKETNRLDRGLCAAIKVVAGARNSWHRKVQRVAA